MGYKNNGSSSLLEGRELPQINMGMVCCRESGLPFFYSTFPGSIVDAGTIKNTLEYLEEYELQNFTFMHSA
jgi:transposase